MAIDSTPFFILGLPRTRTAWLSVVATMAGCACAHEGMRDFEQIEDYALGRECQGDADPSLIYWTAELLKQWPDAKFVVISRDSDDSMNGLIAASPPEMAEEIRRGWGTVERAFATSRDLLRGNPNALFLEFEMLCENHVVACILAHIGAALPTDATLTRWQRLNVTSHIITPDLVTRPPLELPASNQVFAGDVCDVTGLQATLYEPKDFDMVSSWWVVHTGQRIQESALPPLGVLVSNQGEPIAALWCYECFGAPVAELAFPVTRPGLSVADACRSLLYAVSTLIEAAGKAYTPEARFSLFKVLAPAGMVKPLSKLGFKPSLTERKPMILHL